MEYRSGPLDSWVVLPFYCRHVDCFIVMEFFLHLNRQIIYLPFCNVAIGQLSGAWLFCFVSCQSQILKICESKLGVYPPSQESNGLCLNYLWYSYKLRREAASRVTVREMEASGTPQPENNTQIIVNYVIQHHFNMLLAYTVANNKWAEGRSSRNGQRAWLSMI